MAMLEDFHENLFLPGRRCVKNPYAEYHENLTDDLVAGTRSNAGVDTRSPHKALFS
jgi:hypothetical protein